MSQADASTQPLEYMLKVMRDPNTDAFLRAKMAVAAAPYVHAKLGEQGKKEKKDEAAKKLSSRFGASAPPPRPRDSTAH